VAAAAVVATSATSAAVNPNSFVFIVHPSEFSNGQSVT
jgi:hypothetical protein